MDEQGKQVKRNVPPVILEAVKELVSAMEKDQTDTGAVLGQARDEKTGETAMFTVALCVGPAAMAFYQHAMSGARDVVTRDVGKLDV